MDANLLTEGGWKALVVKNKIKDNGLQKALANYENQEKSKLPERLKGISPVAQLAAALKKSKDIAGNNVVIKYLDQVLAAAEAERKEIEALVKAALAKKKKEEEDKQKSAGKEKEGGEDEGEDKEEGDYTARLTAALAKLKSSKGMAYELVVCEAKPVWGIALAKKIGAKQKAELTKVTGGKHFLPGSCRFENGHYIFTLEAKVSGLARKLQDSLKNFTGKKLPVTVGTESAEEEDEGKAGEGAQAAGAGAGGAAGSQAGAAKSAKLTEAAKTWHGTQSTVDSKVTELKKAIQGVYAKEHPDLIKEIDKNLAKLDAIVGKFDTKLEDSLAKASAAGNDAAQKAELQNSKSILADYIKYVKSEPLIAQVDSNPFGVRTNLKQTLVESLTKMAQAIG